MITTDSIYAFGPYAYHTPADVLSLEPPVEQLRGAGALGVVGVGHVALNGAQRGVDAFAGGVGDTMAAVVGMFTGETTQHLAAGRNFAVPTPAADTFPPVITANQLTPEAVQLN